MFLFGNITVGPSSVQCIQKIWFFRPEEALIKISLNVSWLIFKKDITFAFSRCYAVGCHKIFLKKKIVCPPSKLLNELHKLDTRSKMRTCETDGLHFPDYSLKKLNATTRQWHIGVGGGGGVHYVPCWVARFVQRHIGQYTTRNHPLTLLSTRTLQCLRDGAGGH